MIAWLKGKLLEKKPAELLLDVNSVGYRLFITFPTYESLPDTGSVAELYTVTIAREDSLTLYGFSSINEKEMFLKLTSVTRVGPKLAMQALSGMNVDRMKMAVIKSDADTLSKTPGIGKKTAERIIMELKDKIGGEAIGEALSLPTGNEADAVTALENLGYKRTEASRVVAKVIKEKTTNDLAEIIRESLKELSPTAT